MSSNSKEVVQLCMAFHGISPCKYRCHHRGSTAVKCIEMISEVFIRCCKLSSQCRKTFIPWATNKTATIYPPQSSMFVYGRHDLIRCEIWYDIFHLLESTACVSTAVFRRKSPGLLLDRHRRDGLLEESSIRHTQSKFFL